MAQELKAPFPWFGGKSQVAHIVWDRFGNVPNYVEPFFGSGAVLLNRPHDPKIETVNDKDGFVANAWRAIAHDAKSVAEYADWPANENDLHARHYWLVTQRDDLTAWLEGDPEFYDAKIAGWWLWGMACWIGRGFCSGNGPWKSVDGRLVKCADGGGVNRQRLHLSAGQGVNRGGDLYEYMSALQARMRNVRVCCGDWSRVCCPTPTYKNGTTAVFLDPPYSADADRVMGCYAVDDGDVAHKVREWCIKNGENPELRIALCGYEGEGHDDLVKLGWDCVRWSARGGMENHGKERSCNRHREAIWFSPHCLSVGLFGNDVGRVQPPKPTGTSTSGSGVDPART